MAGPSDVHGPYSGSLGVSASQKSGFAVQPAAGGHGMLVFVRSPIQRQFGFPCAASIGGSVGKVSGAPRLALAALAAPTAPNNRQSAIAVIIRFRSCICL